MVIRWKNIIALLLSIVVIVLLICNPTLLDVAVVNLRGLGPGHSAEDRVMGLLTLGLIGVMIVAIVRIVISGERGDRH